MRGLRRSRASAVSSFSASSTASRTNALMSLAPRAQRPRPKPPQKPLTPANPTPLTSVASPSSTRMPASLRICLISSGLPPSKSWLPSTAITGMLDGRVDLATRSLRLLHQAVVRQVAAQQQHVARPAALGQHVSHRRLRTTSR